MRQAIALFMRATRTILAALAILGCFTFATAALADGDAVAKVRDPQQAAALTAEALVLLEKGEDSDDEATKVTAYVEGEKLARRALELDDENADAHFAVFATEGRRLVIEGSVNPVSLLKVNNELDRCLELNPDHSDALAARGGMYRQLPLLLGGNLKKAEADLLRSVELDPQSTGARIELAKTYHEMGEDTKVMPLIEQALYWAEKLNKPRRIREARAFLVELGATPQELPPQQPQEQQPPPELRAQQPQPPELRAQQPQPPELRAQQPQPPELRAQQPQPPELRAQQPQPPEQQAQ